jgi:hypothetical protein
MASNSPQTGYAPVNGLEMYYEVHGTGRPLVLLHGAMSTIETSFGEVLPAFAETRDRAAGARPHSRHRTPAHLRTDAGRHGRAAATARGRGRRLLLLQHGLGHRGPAGLAAFGPDPEARPRLAGRVEGRGSIRRLPRRSRASPPRTSPVRSSRAPTRRSPRSRRTGRGWSGSATGSTSSSRACRMSRSPRSTSPSC